MQGLPQPFVINHEEPLGTCGSNGQLDLLDEETCNANKVHVRCQQRGTRKAITSISGLDQRIDFKKMLKYICRTYSCNGSLQKDVKKNMVIQLTGDKRDVIKEFLSEEGIVKPQSILLHGA